MIRKLTIALTLLIYPSVTMAGESSFETYMERCVDMRPSIEAILKEEGLPDYFFYLALAESGCDPDNRSSKNAMGLYQIVPRTFMAYSRGLCSQDDSPCPLEYAYDPLISTRVASRYLKTLYDRFDHNLDWTVAAYNAGGTNLIRKTGYIRGMGIGAVRSAYPQAYGLAMKVRRFYLMGVSMEENEVR